MAKYKRVCLFKRAEDTRKEPANTESNNVKSTDKTINLTCKVPRKNMNQSLEVR